MEHLALEIFDLQEKGTQQSTVSSQFAVLQKDTSITIVRTNEIFASGDVWSFSFKLNIPANAHIFGTADDLHGSRLHAQINRRRARLWGEGIAMFLGYLKLEDEAEVDKDGNVEVSFESGQKTFDEMIEGTSAQEVSVGDVPIGIALNRKRTVYSSVGLVKFYLDGLSGYASQDERLEGINDVLFSELFYNDTLTPYVQRWPKLVKSHGKMLDEDFNDIQGGIDYTNIQSPYDESHPFCNINICYQRKDINNGGEEVTTRGYIKRLARCNPTTTGGDNQTRYNNSPNFYLLYFIDRMFKDLNIHIDENQALEVEDLRRVFMLNYGCHYEEIEDREFAPGDPAAERYDKYYFPLFDNGNEKYLLKDWEVAGKPIKLEDMPGKVLFRDLKVEIPNEGVILEVGSVEGKVSDFDGTLRLWGDPIEKQKNVYPAYTAYATGENYPKVEISEVVNAMKAMFGVRFIFSDDYKRVRIVLLRNIFRSTEIQDIDCEILGEGEKIENATVGFRMTYGKGKEDTSYYYKGFNDLFPRASKTWKDTTDKHDYSHFDTDAEYDEIKQYVSAMDKTCYVTPVNGNAYAIKVDEEEDVLFPSLLEVAGFMDAEDGDCSKMEDEGETVEEVQIGASPVIMNDIDNTYASLFNGDMKAPTPDNYQYAPEIATFGRITPLSWTFDSPQWWPTHNKEHYYKISGKIDVYISEGFQIRMMDNYSISNGGTPFDEADPGLCFGIMRSSGKDSYVAYNTDPDDDAGEDNQTWEIVPGRGAIDHPDTCDSYGNQWDYNGSIHATTSADAEQEIRSRYPDTANSILAARRQIAVQALRDAGYSVSGDMSRTAEYYYYKLVIESRTEGYVDIYCIPIKEYQTDGQPVVGKTELKNYIVALWNEYKFDLVNHDSLGIILGVNVTNWSTLAYLRAIYFGYTTEKDLDNGLGIMDGRFSLKLRAEKLNPYFDASQPESDSNRRYLEITDHSLRQRGLCDQMYKEYSYWMRNARIIRLPVAIGIAKLMAIDMTKKGRFGNLVGFIRKMEYTINNSTGLGTVMMDIMYI